MKTFETKEVAVILGTSSQALTKAMFDGKINKPSERIGRSFIWTAIEVEKASWAINCRASGLKATTEDVRAIPEGLTVADMLQMSSDLPDTVIYDRYKAGKVLV